MKNILFTGVSSFAGFYFVKKMSENKNINIFCTLTKNIKSYSLLQKSVHSFFFIIFIKKLLSCNDYFFYRGVLLPTHYQISIRYQPK